MVNPLLFTVLASFLSQAGLPEEAHVTGATELPRQQVRASWAAADTAPDTLVVAAAGLRESLDPWLAYRTRQGHRIEVRVDCQTDDQVRDAVRRAAAGGQLEHVVLVGDVQTDPQQVAYHLPTHYVQARINVHWGSEPEIATDNWFADLDDDSLPDVAIGRMSADSPDELAGMIRKTIAYEQSLPQGIWRRRVSLVAGVGGFGLLTDAVLETATRSFIQSGIPEAYQTTMTYASWRSPYCPDPRRFRQEVLARMNEGCLFWVYIGHGRREGLDWVRVPIGAAPILNAEDVPRLACAPGPPIALFLCCYGAAFDGPHDCMAERMVAHGTGPVAAIGGSRVTMPYGMAVLSQAMMQQVFQERPETLGLMLLHAKRTAGADEQGRGAQFWLDSLARLLSPNADDLAGERREHVQLFHLLGDPLLRMPQPAAIEVEVPKQVKAGGDLVVRGRCDIMGQCVVELACRRGKLPFANEPRHEFDASHEGMAALSRVYAQANQDTYVRQQATVSQGAFETRLPVPADATGSYAVRVFVEGAESFALGAATVLVTDTPHNSP